MYDTCQLLSSATGVVMGYRAIEFGTTGLRYYCSRKGDRRKKTIFSANPCHILLSRLTRQFQVDGRGVGLDMTSHLEIMLGMRYRPWQGGNVTGLSKCDIPAFGYDRS